MGAATPRAFITGIAGQDGSYLAELLLAKGYEVHGLCRAPQAFGLDDLAHLAHLRGKVHLHAGDLTDRGSLERAVQVAQPEEVYNLAAFSSVSASFADPVRAVEVNALGAVKLLEAMKAHAPRARLYQAGSSEMFGEAAESPQGERTPFRPVSPYAYAKAMAFWAMLEARRGERYFAVNGILFNHESPRRGEQFVTRKVCRAAVRIAAGLQKELVLGNLDARRDWGFAPEYVDAMWRMVQHPEPEDFVIATGESHSVREFVQLAFEAAGLRDWQGHVRTDRAFERPLDAPALCGDPSKARDLLGWRPRTSFKELVGLLVEAERARLPQSQG